MNRVNTFLLTFLAVTISSCASVEKAPLQSDNPNQALSEVTRDSTQMKNQQVDFLAYDEFSEGTDDLQRAQKMFRAENETEEVMSYLAQAKAHFVAAGKEANERRNGIDSSILDARNKAMQYDIDDQEWQRQLDATDSAIRSSTDDFAENLSTDDLSSFQNRYFDLEKRAVQLTKLRSVYGVLSYARSLAAEEQAPVTLARTEKETRLAENKIALSPRNKSEYEQAVYRAKTSAKLLQDVMVKLQNEAKGAPEMTALELVRADRKIGKLSENLVDVTDSLAETTAELYSTETALSGAKQQLEFDEAIKLVRKNIPESEADVYRKGDELIIRMKDIEFPINSAQLPEDAKGILEYVQNLIQRLNPTNVTVQGHTDSTGSDKWNAKLSRMRAEAVVGLIAKQNPDYTIKSEGFGSSKPLTSNKTREGRETNRRVDIVVSRQ